ncbi:unnamed protein product, partial [marine sediment metagenome]
MGSGLEPKEFLDPFTGFLPKPNLAALTLKGEGSSYFAGIRDGIKIHSRVRYWALSGLPDVNKIETHGLVYRHGGLVGPAVIKKEIGEGLLYLLPLPLGFVSLRGQRDLDQAARRILLEAVGDRYKPLFTQLKWKLPPAGKIHFADDFMRNSDLGTAWRREQGSISLTGESKVNPMAFSLKTSDNASAITGNPGWSSYRLCASLFPGNGEAGIWLTTSTKRRLALIFDSASQNLKLYALPVSDASLLAKASIPGPNSGWRQIALLQRDNTWQGWMDGR